MEIHFISQFHTIIQMQFETCKAKYYSCGTVLVIITNCML